MSITDLEESQRLLKRPEPYFDHTKPCYTTAFLKRSLKSGSHPTLSCGKNLPRLQRFCRGFLSWLSR